MPTFSNLLLIQPDLLNIKPMMSEDASVEELDGELRKIAEDEVMTQSTTMIDIRIISLIPIA